MEMEREDVIDLSRMFSGIKKRIWMIVSFTVLATFITGAVSYFVLPPIYEAKTELMVNKADAKEVYITQQDIQANLQLIDTYNVVIKSPRIMDQVAQKVGMVENEEDLIKDVTVEGVKNSQVISIAVENKDQKKAVFIANTIASVFIGEISKIMKVDNVQVLTTAKENPKAKPVKPNKLLNMGIAFAGAFFISVGIAFLLESLDRSIKNEEDAEAFLHLPLLGTIHQVTDKDFNKADLLASARKVGMNIEEQRL